MNKMSLRKALKIIESYVETIENHYPGYCSKTEGIMGACKTVIDMLPEELSKEPSEEAVTEYCFKRNIVLLSKEQYISLKKQYEAIRGQHEDQDTKQEK